MRYGFMIALVALPVLADVESDINWKVDCAAPASYPVGLVSGESQNLRIQYWNRSSILTLTNATRIAFLFRPAGTTNVPYEIAGSVQNATNGKVRIHWAASNVVAAGAYDYRVTVAGESAVNLKAYGTLTIDGGFGTASGSPPPYVQLMDSNSIAAMIAAFGSSFSDGVARAQAQAAQEAANAAGATGETARVAATNAQDLAAIGAAHTTESSNTVHGGFILSAWIKATNALAIAQAAFGWGNHATAGYVTGTVVRVEIDPTALPKDGSGVMTGTLVVSGELYSAEMLPATVAPETWTTTPNITPVGGASLLWEATGSAYPTTPLPIVAGHTYRVIVKYSSPPSSDTVTVSLGGVTNTYTLDVMSVIVSTNFIAVNTDNLNLTATMAGVSMIQYDMSVKEVTQAGVTTYGDVTADSFHGDGTHLTGIPTTNVPAWIARTNLTLAVIVTNDLERPQYLYATGAVSVAFAGLREPLPMYLIIKGPSSVTFPAGTHFIGGASWQTNQANHFIVWQYGTNLFCNPVTTSEN